MDKLGHRGKSEGCGILARTGNQTMRLKSMVIKDIVDYVKELNDGDLVIIHQRKASVGTINLDNTHPVLSNNKKVNVIHNGTRKIYKEILDASSDTQGLATLLSMTNQSDHGELMNELGVVFYTYNGKIYFYKDELRPLVKSKTHNIMASEPLFDGEWAEVSDVDTPHQFNFDKEKIGKYVNVTKGVGVARYCSSCKKTHLPSDKGVCMVCAVQGKSASTTTTTTTYRGGGNAYAHQTHDLNFNLKVGTTYRITRDVVWVDSDKSHIPFNGTDCKVNYERKIDKWDKSLYVYITVGKLQMSIAVDIDKFAKLNKLGKYAEDVKKLEAPKKVVAIVKANEAYVLNADMIIGKLADTIGEKYTTCRKTVKQEITNLHDPIWVHIKNEKNEIVAFQVDTQKFLVANNLITIDDGSEVIYVVSKDKKYKLEPDMMDSTHWKSRVKRENILASVKTDKNIRKNSKTFWVTIDTNYGTSISLSIDAQAFAKIQLEKEKTKDSLGEGELKESMSKELAQQKQSKFELLDKCYECSGKVPIPLGTENWGWCVDCRSYTNRHDII